jgi:hypothetical protein
LELIKADRLQKDRGIGVEIGQNWREETNTEAEFLDIIGTKQKSYEFSSLLFSNSQLTLPTDFTPSPLNKSGLELA